MKKIAVSVVVFLSLQAAGQTSSTSSSPQVSLNFLQIAPDARSAGIGLTGAATSPDNFSNYWNPAKLSAISGQEYGASAAYSPWMQKLAKGMGLATVSGFRRLDEESVFGLDIRFFQLGKVDFKDEVGYNIYTYNPTEWTIGLSYSRKISDHSHVGATLRYIDSRPAMGIPFQDEEVKKVTGIGADVGFYYSSIATDEENGDAGCFRFGAALQNIGNKVHYYSLSPGSFQPMNLKLGVSYDFPTQTENKFTLSADLNKLLVPLPPAYDADGNIISGKDPDGVSVPSALFSSWSDGFKTLGIAAGLEYGYNNQFFLRGGVYHENPQYSAKQLATFGAGFKAGGFHVDVSYFTQMGNKGVGTNAMAETFKISLGFSLQSGL